MAKSNTKTIAQAYLWSRGISLGQGKRRNKTKISSSRREGAKVISVTNKSTYNSVSKARESKIPDGSSVRSLKSRSLKATRDGIDQIVRAVLTLTPHFPPRLESCMTKSNKKTNCSSSFIKQRHPSCWARANEKKN